MQTAIGRSIQTPRRRRTAAVLAVLLVSCDFAFVIIPLGSVGQSCRAAMGIVALAAAVWVTDGDRISLGLCAAPTQGWRSWIHTSIMIATAVAAALGLSAAIFQFAGRPLAIQVTSPNAVTHRLLWMCCFAPTTEETVYRVTLCVCLVPSLGCWKTIFLSGGLFALLHVVYGNPSSENLVGGFFLAWAYLKSETILVPLLLHAGGNFIALSAQVGAWYAVESAG